MAIAPVAVDDVSLILIVLITAFLIASKMRRHWYQPALHPLILSRQADASNVRGANESPVYRNINAPIGLDLAMRPQRSAPDVPGLLLDGLSPSDNALPRRIFDATLSNADLIEQATRFAYGLALLLPGELRTLVVYGSLDSARAAVALLAGAGFKGLPNIVTAVVPTGASVNTLPVEGPVAVLNLAESASPIKGDLVIACDTAHAAAMGSGTVQWNDILGAAVPAQVPRAQNVYASMSELDSIGQRTFAWFYDVKRAIWLIATHTSMTSGVTALLSEYTAESIPKVGDHIVVSINPGSAFFCAILMMALYSGSAVTYSVHTATAVRDLRPTIIYADRNNAMEFAHSLEEAVPGSYASSLRKRHLHSLRNGIIPRDDFVDRLVGVGVRRSAGAENVRHVVVIGAGCAASQELLDSLRVHLAVPVIHAYMPSEPAADGTPVAFTAPVSASNVYDFQAFAANNLGDRELAAHVGPPSVSVELKIVTDSEAARAHAGVVSHLRSDTTSGAQDCAIGEILVRGYSVVSASIEILTPRSNDFLGSAWIATGDIGFVRTNGTVVVVQEKGQSKPGVANFALQ